VATNEEGAPRTRPMPTMFSSGGSVRRAESALSQDEPGPSVFFPRPAHDDGDSDVTGGPSGRGGNNSHAEGQELLLPQSGQMLGGLKHRLLSFILECIQDFETIPAIVRCRYTVCFVRFTSGVCVDMTPFTWLQWSTCCHKVEETICQWSLCRYGEFYLAAVEYLLSVEKTME